MPDAAQYKLFPPGIRNHIFPSFVLVNHTTYEKTIYSKTTFKVLDRHAVSFSYFVDKHTDELVGDFAHFTTNFAGREREGNRPRTRDCVSVLVLSETARARSHYPAHCRGGSSRAVMGGPRRPRSSVRASNPLLRHRRPATIRRTLDTLAQVTSIAQPRRRHRRRLRPLPGGNRRPASLTPINGTHSQPASSVPSTRSPEASALTPLSSGSTLRALALAGWAPSCFDCAVCGAGAAQGRSRSPTAVPSAAPAARPAHGHRRALLDQLLSGDWVRADRGGVRAPASSCRPPCSSQRRQERRRAH